jgi:hypothetical protein
VSMIYSKSGLHRANMDAYILFHIPLDDPLFLSRGNAACSFQSGITQLV